VLEERACIPPLGAPDELAPVEYQLAARRHLEAWGLSWERRSVPGVGELGRHPHSPQRANEQLVDTTIGVAQPRPERERRGNGVGQLAMVQHCPPSSGPPDQVDLPFGDALPVVRL
jgi:hypothetical protein